MMELKCYHFGTIKKLMEIDNDHKGPDVPEGVTYSCFLMEVNNITNEVF